MNGPTGTSGRDVEGLQLLSGAGNDMVNFVADENGGQPLIKLTRRGAATRAAIVQAAAELIYVNGVALTGLDEVLVASATSKSQFYRHFTDKTDLVRAVISFRADEVISRQCSRLENVDSIRGLQQWADRFVQRSALRRGAWGCELGSLSAELADVDEFARARLAHHFHTWEKLLAETFDRMRDRGVLRADIDSMRLAVAVMAAVQGGYLLAQTAHDSAPMEVAATMAIDYVRTFELKPPPG
jgi:TetR/AcrR family transcriptional repressor of nem operon